MVLSLVMSKFHIYIILKITLSDRPSSNPLEFCAVQRIVRNNSAPLATRQMTTRCDQQGVKLKEEFSSSTERGSSSSDANNLTGLK